MHFLTELISNAGGRANNEDYCGYKESTNSICWCLADGLGGHKGGEVASKLAVDTILQSFEDRCDVSVEFLKELFNLAQNKLLATQDEVFFSMCTTLVVLLSDYNEAVWAYIGDSRLYYFSNDQIVYQTKDHSVPQSLVDSGEITNEQIRNHPDRNRLLRVLGRENDVKPSFYNEKVTLKIGDAFLLCSDGFWEYINEIEMVVDLVKSASPKDWLEHMQDRILSRAASDNDNYSAIAVWAV
ncbi:MAG: serine/threonine-protein phosphatase [Nitrospirae bacterium]|nr:serine/threonine-protein phosphatase [Nitrospirota bacterium]